MAPAKSLDYATPIPATLDMAPGTPDFLKKSAVLIKLLKKKNALELMHLMGISEALAVLNKARYASWTLTPAPDQGRSAIFAFNGDVYEGLNALTLSAPELVYVQEHVRILSGLYGVLRPLDTLQAYRLEMGTRLDNPSGVGLYAFWGDTIAKKLASELTGPSPVLVNLASEEYFKSVRLDALAARVITPVFQDWKTDRYKIISFHAKRARGLMARYCAQQGVTDPEQLKNFTLEGYAYDALASSEQQWVFRRKIAA